MKKSRALAILFGLMPGAGHMYLGKMKRGMTLLILFWGILAVASFLGMGALALGMLVVWFYAFFDVVNLSALPPEQLEAVPDQFMFGLRDGTNIHNQNRFKPKTPALGWGFIIVGILLLYNTLSSLIFGSLANFLASLGFSVEWLWNVYYDIPQLAVGVLVIFLGIRFMRGGKKNAPKDDLRQYIGDGQENSICHCHNHDH